MKTMKIISSTLLVVLATSSFGQLGGIKERLFPDKPAQVRFHTVDYNAETSRIEDWVSNINDRISHRNMENLNEKPVVYHTIYTRQAEVIFEHEMGMEHWMAIPFENSQAEEQETLENWMVDPFEIDMVEEYMPIETWMTVPFETENAKTEISLEEWMSVPFESPVDEEALCLEEWMTTPFNVQEDLEVEGWMIASSWK